VEEFPNVRQSKSRRPVVLIFDDYAAFSEPVWRSVSLGTRDNSWALHVVQTAAGVLATLQWQLRPDERVVKCLWTTTAWNFVDGGVLDPCDEVSETLGKMKITRQVQSE
jgi:hypothetical protein